MILENSLLDVSLFEGHYDAMTPTAKRKWTVVLDYNWDDCHGLRELAITVAQDLSTRSEVSRHAA